MKYYGARTVQVGIKRRTRVVQRSKIRTADKTLQHTRTIYISAARAAAESNAALRVQEERRR